jgi:NAD(P)-dependent dehydrogenase (short-subunit alcohol dehydrogenase family)
MPKLKLLPRLIRTRFDCRFLTRLSALIYRKGRTQGCDAMGNLRGRSAIVTGAAGGIGRELVQALLQAGAAVMATDLSNPGLSALEQIIATKHLTELFSIRQLDLADYAACVDAVEATSARFGAVDILVNNAAMGMGFIREDHMTNLVAIQEITPQTWDRFVAVNFSGAWYLTHAAAPHMKRAGWGRIITVTTSFFTMLRGKFHLYGPTKAGLEAMAAGHAQEFAGSGITVNVVVPGGPTDTPMVPAIPGVRRSDLIPPAKMTHPILWLCSSAADAVTGKRFIAAHWDESGSVENARAASEAPIAWPELARAPVWPGGKPIR